MFRPIHIFCLALLTSAHAAMVAQVLFPGNSLERRSRTFDVIHYKIVVDFDEAEKKVDGVTSITFTPLSSRLDSLVLDAADMDIRSVSLSSGPVRFANRSPQLTVFFDRSLGLTDTLTVAIDYSCRPSAGLYFVQPDSANPKRRRQIWSQGEDTDNHFWFPCYDYLNDKATSEVIGTVPESYRLVSNGRLISATHDQQRGTRTFHWFEAKLHSSYLIMVAAGEYEVVTEQYGNIPLEYYVYKDRKQDGVRSLAKTSAAMKFFEESIGVRYPWEKYAQIWISNFMWGGMENVSAVTLNDDTYLLDPRAQVDFTSDDVMAHELAHQWWGDLITSRDWSNLWLHEGFANYFEALFKQYEKGDDHFQYDLMQQATSVLNTEDAYGRSPLVGCDGYSANVYSKGCWVLHMLRNTLGEEGFWKTIRLFAQRYAFRNADTYELMLTVEDATGQSLGWFFDQWAYKAGHPKVAVTSAWDEERKTLQLEFTQKQTIDSLTGAFRFPISIEVTTSSGVTTSTVLIDQEKEQFSIRLPEQPLMVILDKGKNLLATFDWKKTKEEYTFQLGSAGDIVDRIAAANELRQSDGDSVVFEALRRAALGDRFWAVRNQALLALEGSDNPDVKQVLLEASRDKHSSVRASAFGALSRFPSPEVADVMWSAALTDSSYLVLTACIGALAEIDSVRGFDLAARYVQMESYRDIVRRAALEAFLNLKDPSSVPFALTYSAISYPTDIRRQSVRLLSEAAKASLDASDRLAQLVDDDVPSIRKAAIEGLAALGDPQMKDVVERRRSIEKEEAVRRAIEAALEILSGGASEDLQK